MKSRSDDANASSTMQKETAKSPVSAPFDSHSKIAAESSSPGGSAPTRQERVASKPLANESQPASIQSDVTDPRVFLASTLKPVSAIDTVTSTISALSQHANRGISSLIAAHAAVANQTGPLTSVSADRSTPLQTDGSVSPIYDAFHNAGSAPDPARIEAALNHANDQQRLGRTPLPRILWSRWDRLPVEACPLKWAPLLITYFDDGTLQALLVQDREISELLCLPNAAEVLHDRQASSSHARPQLLTASVRHPSADSTGPHLLLVLQGPDNAALLLAYSLATHRVEATAQLQHCFVPPPDVMEQGDDRRSCLWPQVEAQCNERFLVLSFASPASIHVLSASTLEYLHTPIFDVSAPSVDRPPPISLSHRLLAFACGASLEVSPIRSDAGKVSKTLYRDASRVFAGVQGDTSGRVGELRDNLFETSAHVGDAARRIRGGVMSGVRTLGEWGSSYWPHAGSPPTTAAFSPPQPSLLSQSAPHTAHPSRATSSVSSSPMLLAADGGRNAKRLSTGAAAAVPVKLDNPAGANAGGGIVYTGCVRVIDLSSQAHTVCTFAASTTGVALVAFSPCGRLILTADSLGHAFHVFEISLSGALGNAAASLSPAVLHRYKLMRGITTAEVVHAEWSADAQWIAVGTRSGTVHIYAVNPFGGAPSIGNHIQGKVRNPTALQPFGVSLASLARSARPSPSPSQDTVNSHAMQPATAMPTVTQTRSSPPAFLLVGNSLQGSAIECDTSSPFKLLTNDPRGASVTLHTVRCWSSEARASVAPISSEDLHSAHAPEAKQRFTTATSPRSSGLSQMMRKAGEGLLPGHAAPRLQAECLRIALWDQLSPEAGAVTKQSASAPLDESYAARTVERLGASRMKPLASVAKAEIETYSQSPAILPSSIFLSRQTFFHARLSSNRPSSTQLGLEDSMRCVHRRGSRPIQVRRTAHIVSREPLSEDPSPFDDSLAGALDRMSFDPDKQPPRSASAHIPSFPQGQRGRSSGWTSNSSIPIRIVAGGLGGIYRAGKELGRGVDMARRRTSGASGTAAPDGAPPTVTTASLSFDGVDDVDVLGEEQGVDCSDRRQRDHGSLRSESSLLSTLRNDEPSRGSQSSSAETPSTRFSEAEELPTRDVEADADECDWDSIEASRSPAAPQAALCDLLDGDYGQTGKEHNPSRIIRKGDHDRSLDDDFTVGVLDEDSGEAAMYQPLSTLWPSQEAGTKANAAKELVYALPVGGSTRSSPLSQSQSSGLTTTLESRATHLNNHPAPRNNSPSKSEGSDAGSQASAGSNLLCEGSKETHTSESSIVASVTGVERAQATTTATKPRETSGGKKKKARR